MAQKIDAPLKIFVSSDGTELEFVECKKAVYYYKYVNSRTKNGLLLTLTADDLKKFLKSIDRTKHIKPAE